MKANLLEPALIVHVCTVCKYATTLLYVGTSGVNGLHVFTKILEKVHFGAEQVVVLNAKIIRFCVIIEDD